MRLRRWNPPLTQELRDRAIGWIAQQGGVDALPEVLSLAELINAFQCSEAAAYTWLEADKLPGGQIVAGGVWRCTRDAFERWLNDDRYWPPPSGQPGASLDG